MGTDVAAFDPRGAYVYPEYAVKVIDGGDIFLHFRHSDDCGSARVVLARDDAECLLKLIDKAIFESMEADA